MDVADFVQASREIACLVPALLLGSNVTLYLLVLIGQVEHFSFFFGASSVLSLLLRECVLLAAS